MSGIYNHFGKVVFYLDPFFQGEEDNILFNLFWNRVLDFSETWFTGSDDLKEFLNSLSRYKNN